MSAITTVNKKALHDLLITFAVRAFEAVVQEEGTLEEEVATKCEHLFKKDYSILELDNKNATLSARYPCSILIPECEHFNMVSTIDPHNTSIFSENVIATTIPQNYSAINKNVPQPTVCTSSSTTSSGSSSSSTTPSTSSTSTTIALNRAGIRDYLTFADSEPPLDNPNPQSDTAILTTNPNYKQPYDICKIRELVTMARYARCRQRFVVPVIMYRGKFICRSATISVNAETYGRKVVDYAYDCLSGTNNSDRAGDENKNTTNSDSSNNPSLTDSIPFTYEEVIKSDIQLLNTLNVNTIVDLMVENRKIKYFMPVSSSEKADPDNHYEDFKILALPYPGCEFFSKLRDNNYEAKGLYYDWSQAINDADISVPDIEPVTKLNINWSEYRSWELVLLTQNYLKACLKCIKEEKSGLLVHCISGWDRTPLFISLIRLSLWADGLIHQSLNALQITYFTVGYDWFLFGHRLPDRLKKKEDIMFFCFSMLKYIADDEFSISDQRKRTKTSSSSGSSGGGTMLTIPDDCEDETNKEELNSSIDLDSNDGSVSNMSNSDISMMDTFFETSPTSGSNTVDGSNTFTNRSPNPKRSRTSPISVPSRRQRQESTSSNNENSWLMVNDTGSVDSVMNGSFMRTLSQQELDGSKPTTKNKTPTTRMQRLHAVRAIFIKAYGQSIGLQIPEGSTISISALLDSLTEQLF